MKCQNSKKSCVTLNFFVPCALLPLFHYQKVCLQVMRLSSVGTLACLHVHHSILSLIILLFVFPLLGLSVSSFASSLSVLLCLVMPRFLLKLNRVRWHFLCTLPFFLFYIYLSRLLCLWSPVHVEVRTGEMEMSQPGETARLRTVNMWKPHSTI